jgi:hypothetical protein
MLSFGLRGMRITAKRRRRRAIGKGAARERRE